MLNSKEINAYVYAVRTQTTNLILTIQKLAALRDKMNALSLAAASIDNVIAGDNEGITNAQVTAVLGTSFPEFENIMKTGHATNLHAIAII